ncbi:hypothetical protein COU78_06140 [Candidatus Peregrinibacteria bacterium CG10_big_fil_rev_8_21_14_0_10_49_24]|nr:MAG: hypothetical protein COV83_02975 [Candidatus Peregrinibacteria bacterium CG11_big_fil_rev_8_21_14_0_20_49_14]PIR50436.1 MAG: hypothetical protein COU78_06140 [Candidatus Peregrinibacteria bacterium CG10_big_fil_rev_8_21_14_0_10_49_24]PJA68272.1 MAG: hypothetical protein CO157_00130 [Candidatus Peregrinibacteria bacterium CG_4_9_14_3_um_filter_49_12]
MLFTGIRLYFSGYADGASGVRQNTKGEGAFVIIRALFGLPLAIGFLAYMAWPPLMEWSHLPLSDALRWAGALLMTLSLPAILWVQKHLSRNFTGTVQIRPDGHVVKTGPYAFVRHPMYLVFLLLGTGILFLTANWFLGGGFLLVVLIVMIVRTPIEERELLNAYGEEYEKYMQHTARFLPSFLSMVKQKPTSNK